MLVDSGASVSVIKPGIVAAEIQTTKITARGITGSKLRVMGTQDMTFKLGNRVFNHEFLVAPLDAEYSGILGVDVLGHMEASIDFRTSTLLLGRKRYQLSDHEVERCQTIRRQNRPSQGTPEAGLRTPLKAPSTGQVEEPIPGSNPGGVAIDSWNVVALGSVMLPPLSEGLVIGRIEKNHQEVLPGDVLIEPLGLGTPGAYVARVASRVMTAEELDELKALTINCRGQGDKNTGVRENHQGNNVPALTINCRGQGNKHKQTHECVWYPVSSHFMMHQLENYAHSYVTIYGQVLRHQETNANGKRLF